MPKRKHTAEEIINKLREAEIDQHRDTFSFVNVPDMVHCGGRALQVKTDDRLVCQQ